MISLNQLPIELLLIILDQLFQPRYKDITILIRLAMVNKRFRQIIYSTSSFWSGLKLSKSGSNPLLGPLADDGLLNWITRPQKIMSGCPVQISKLLINLDLSNSQAVSSKTIISILQSCPNLESLSCFNCPWVFPSELRVGLAKNFNIQSASLALKSLDIDFCGGAAAFESCDYSGSSSTRSSYPFRISGNSRLRLALNHSLSWSAHFYDICHIEYMLMRVCKYGSDFELNPHPCPTCHTQIARRSHRGSEMITSGLCIRCEAKEISHKRRSEYRIPVL